MKSLKSEEIKRLKKELEKLSGKYNEIYYSKTWQSFLFIKDLIKKIKKNISLIFSPPLRMGDLCRIIKEEGVNSGKIILVNLPLMNWKRKKQRPHQICEQFARDGHLVFYISNHFIVESKPRLTKEKIAKRVEIRKVGERIYEVILVSFQDLVITADKLENQWDKKYLKWSLDVLLKAIGRRKRVLKVDFSFWYSLVLGLKEFLIYDCMDEFSVFRQTGSALELEPLLAQESDVVLASANLLYKKMKKFNKNCFLIENAADFNHFSKKSGFTPADIKYLKHPIIGYYGAISDWFDDKLLFYLAKKQPNWQFVLIGNINNPLKYESLKDCSKNITFLGEKPYDSLPSYLHLFDVCLIPFLKNSLTEAVSPIKFFEYLSAGKPVVAVDLLEIRKYKEYVYIAKGKKDFLKKIDLALREDKEILGKQRQEFAKQNTWQIRYKQIKNIIDKK